MRLLNVKGEFMLIKVDRYYYDLGNTVTSPNFEKVCVEYINPEYITNTTHISQHKFIDDKQKLVGLDMAQGTHIIINQKDLKKILKQKNTIKQSADF